MRARVVFALPRLKRDFERLKTSRTEDRKLFDWLNRAFNELAKDPFCAIQIPKRLIPQKYPHYRIDNLWKYDLPTGWRLLYSVARDTVIILAIVIEWLFHKE